MEHMSDERTKGREEMWGAIKKILAPSTSGGYSCYEMSNIFGDEWYDRIFGMSADDALSAISKYERSRA